MYKKFRLEFLFILIFIMVALLFLYSCQTGKAEVKKEENTIQQEEKTEQESQKTEEETKEEKPVNLVNKEYEGVIFENVPENLDLSVLKKELETFFLEYEKVVLSKNYDQWLTMISPGYYKRYNSLDYLKKINATAYGIYNIKQYFFKVVYASRVSLNNGEPLKIYKIVFKENDLDRAIVLVKFENKILKYYFIKIDQKWKISINDEFFAD